MDASERGETEGHQAPARPVVCIVDDDGSVRRALRTLLRSTGFEGHAYGSAQEFLCSAMAARCACLIADVRMPGMGGFELQQALRAHHAGLPVIFMSAHADEDTRGRALAAGAVAMLSKPFSEVALLRCVREALERRGA